MPQGQGRSESGRTTSRARAFLQQGKGPVWGQLVVALLLAALGFAAVTQVRDNQSEDSYGALREQDLIDLLVGHRATSERAASELVELERERDDLKTEIRRREGLYEQTRSELKTQEVLAGLVPVSGPGVRITITADEGELLLNTLVYTMTLLRGNHAEAIEVNDQVRMTNRDSIEQTARAFRFAGEELRSPYVFDVIGPAPLLIDGIEFPRGPRDLVEDTGAEIKVEPFDSISIASVSTTPEIDEAIPEQ